MDKMENKERFLDLLSRKDELQGAEKEQLDSFINNDKEAAELYEAYLYAEKGVKNSYHLSIDEISDYVLHLNNEQPENPSVIGKIPLIENHLRKCQKCNDIFLELNGEHEEIFSFVESNLAPGKEAPVQQVINRNIRPLSFKYLTVSSFAILLLFFGTLLVSYFTTPRAYEFAKMDDSSLYITRGRATNEFEQGLKALDNKNYNEAITFFKNDISNHQNDKSVFYTSYILGLTYLESAEKNVAGLFRTYDSKKVKEGIRYLETAVAKNTTGEFPNVNFDAHFYIGKGYLMLNEKVKASEYFRKVLASKGGKMDEAKKILSELK